MVLEGELFRLKDERQQQMWLNSKVIHSALSKHSSFVPGLDLWFLRVSCMKAEFASFISLPTPILLISPPLPPLELISSPSVIIAVIYTLLNPVSVACKYMFRGDHLGLGVSP